MRHNRGTDRKQPKRVEDLIGEIATGNPLIENIAVISAGLVTNKQAVRAPLERAGLEDDACELVLERADRGIPSATNAAGTGSATLALTIVKK